VLAATVVAGRGRAGQFAQIAAHPRATTALSGDVSCHADASRSSATPKSTATATFLSLTPLAPAPVPPQPPATAAAFPPPTRRYSEDLCCMYTTTVIGALPGLYVRTRCHPVVGFPYAFPRPRPAVGPDVAHMQKTTESAVVVAVIDIIYIYIFYNIYTRDYDDIVRFSRAGTSDRLCSSTRPDALNSIVTPTVPRAVCTHNRYSACTFIRPQHSHSTVAVFPDQKDRDRCPPPSPPPPPPPPQTTHTHTHVYTRHTDTHAHTHAFTRPRAHALRTKLPAAAPAESSPVVDPPPRILPPPPHRTGGKDRYDPCRFLRERG